MADSYKVRLSHKFFLGYMQLAGFANAFQAFKGDVPKVDFKKLVGFDRQKSTGIQEVMVRIQRRQAVNFFSIQA